MGKVLTSIARATRQRTHRAPPWRARDLRDTANIDLLIAFCLRRDDVALDLGANRGRFLREMVRVAPDGRHWAFEPVPNLAEQLSRAHPSVEVRQAAVADYDGMVEFEVMVDRPTLSSMTVGRTLERLPYVGERRRIEVPVCRLDTVIPKDCRPSLVKIDVEGAELAVLRGAADVLRNSQPLVIIELSSASGDVAEAWDLLCAHAGLRMFTITGDGPLPRESFRERLYNDDMVNWVAHP